MFWGRFLEERALGNLVIEKQRNVCGLKTAEGRICLWAAENGRGEGGVK